MFDISIRIDVLATYNVYVNFLKTEAFPGPTSNTVMRILFLSTAVQTRVFKVFLQKYTIHPFPLHPLARDFCDLEAGSLFYPFDYRLIVE